MKNKLQLQDFTFFINILKDSNKWNIDDLTKKLGKDIETIVYMLNIMSEVYSVNGENFIDFEIDSSENLIFFETMSLISTDPDFIFISPRSSFASWLIWNDKLKLFLDDLSH